jgi:hypothetical protein
MKKVILTSLIVMIVAGATFANPEGVCPEGKLIGHLKIIGVKDPKSVKMEDKAAGNVIFVLLGENGEPANTEISLVQGPEFAVLDKNGTDGEAAFMMKPTGLDPYIIGGDMTGVNTESLYSVFLRALGTPGGKATMYTCAEVADAFAPWLSNKVEKTLTSVDPAVGEEVCSLEQITSDILVRESKKPKFINVTAELLTVVFEVTYEYMDGDVLVEETIIVRVPVFSNLLQGYFWNYDNEGLKNLDVRFYDCSTNVAEDDETNYPGEFPE